MDKVQFETNRPVEIALKFDPPGKLVQGHYGDQMYYTVLNGTAELAMYVPPVVDQRIQDQRIRAGERFTVTKAEVRNGTRRGIEWQVRRVDPRGQPFEQPAASPGQEARPASSEHSEKHSTDSSAPVTKLEAALRTAIVAAQASEKFARETGRPITFTTEDIRAMALTLVINASREQRV